MTYFKDILKKYFPDKYQEFKERYNLPDDEEENSEEEVEE